MPSVEVLVETVHRLRRMGAHSNTLRMWLRRLQRARYTHSLRITAARRHSKKAALGRRIARGLRAAQLRRG